MHRIIFLLTLICSTNICDAQRNPDKGLIFCGWKYADVATIEKAFSQKISFLDIHDGDLVADIGASGGTFEGAISAIGNWKNVHFVLVDIDSNCLNQQKVNNMKTYYTQVKGSPFTTEISFVRNTPDSLYLAHDTYHKIFLLNTLHEITDQQKMVKDIYKVLRKGGEVIVDEMMARPRHLLHGGCQKPLLDEITMKTLFEQNGFKQDDTLANPDNSKWKNNPETLFRFIKN